MALVDTLVKVARQVIAVNLVQVVILVCLAIQVLVDILVNLESVDILVSQDILELLDILVSQEPVAIQVNQELADILVILEIVESLDIQDLENQELVVTVVLVVILAGQVLVANLVFQDIAALASLGLQAILEIAESLVIVVTAESLVILENLA